MMYHLYLNHFWKVYKLAKTFFWKLAVQIYMSTSVYLSLFQSLSSICHTSVFHHIDSPRYSINALVQLRYSNKAEKQNMLIKTWDPINVFLLQGKRFYKRFKIRFLIFFPYIMVAKFPFFKPTNELNVSFVYKKLLWALFDEFGLKTAQNPKIFGNYWK